MMQSMNLWIFYDLDLTKFVSIMYNNIEENSSRDCASLLSCKSYDTIASSKIFFIKNKNNLINDKVWFTK